MPLSDIAWVNPSHILDIGANVGGFSKEALALWPNASSLMIEANPECSGELSATGIPFIIAVLSDSEKDAVFYQRKCGGTSTGDSLYRENTPWYDDENVVMTDVKTITLDRLVEEYFDLIKLDVQGSELDILRGGERTLSGANHVLMEVSVEQYNIGAPLWDEVVRFMAERGFGQLTDVGDIIHPIGRHLIQKDILFSRRSRDA